MQKRGVILEEKKSLNNKYQKIDIEEKYDVFIKYLFEQVGANRIGATHDKNNPKSGRVMQKLGMTYEGTLRRAEFNNQGIVDAVHYSILKEEYV